MGMGLTRNLRVDNLPFYLKPLVKAYGVVGANAWTMCLSQLRQRCEWEIENGERYQQACLHAAWHECVPAYLCSYMLDTSMPQHHYWLQHPAAYMAPIHELLTMHGIDFILGSSGYGGQTALKELEGTLIHSTANGSSAFFVDGPAGPLKQVKPGVIQLAQSTGLPIIPIRFEFTDSWRIGWDQKHFPKPGSLVRVFELEPMLISPALDVNETAIKLQNVLDGDD